MIRFADVAADPKPKKGAAVDVKPAPGPATETPKPKAPRKPKKSA